MDTVAQEMNARARKIRNFRLFAFARDVAEFTPSTFAKYGNGLGYGTDMHSGISAIAKINQDTTIIMSDGETADGTEILRCASRMAGTIHCLYCGSDADLRRAFRAQPDNFYGAPLMIELARIGEGRCVPIGHQLEPAGFREALQEIFQPAASHGGNMKRYPDHHIQGNQIDFRRPPDKHFDVTQHVHVHHRTVINHHRHAPQQIEHGEPGQQTTYLQGVQITEHQAPAERQQIADRGHVIEVRHQHAALPKPGIRMPGAHPLALPAPTRAQNGRPLDPRRLPAPQQQPMQPVSARARVLAAFNQAKR